MDFTLILALLLKNIPSKFEPLYLCQTSIFDKSEHGHVYLGCVYSFKLQQWIIVFLDCSKAEILQVCFTFGTKHWNNEVDTKIFRPNKQPLNQKNQHSFRPFVQNCKV
ncbi:Hypothetical predicted protein [Octopus vulgaris]|uniref:Uncharacterized protein n=1 Tax=Octopus vulgaris TaxID=6645 RepID=A0AA36BGB3_OCTVU|nr:Hypothetical predicted protein [Octopus vulgaris]